MSELTKQQREELKGIAAAIEAVGPLIEQVERLEGENAKLKRRVLKLQVNCLNVRDAHNTYRRTGLESDSEALQAAAGQCNTPDLIELPPHLEQQLTAAEERAGKLPKTADGVPVNIFAAVPATRLYWTYQSDKVYSGIVVGWMMQPEGPNSFILVDSEGDAEEFYKDETQCFSTEAAAQAAKPGACDCGICHGEGLIGNDGQTCPCIIAGCKKRHGRDEYMPSAAKQEGK
jgi:hypothetical protein